MTEITDRRETLSEAKRALLERRRAGLAHAPRPREAIPRRAGPGPEFPASYMQEQMWLAVQADPSLPIYNVPVAVLVRADADVDALGRAFSEVVRRHEGLRTVFRFTGGELRQVVLPPYPVRVDARDLRDSVGDDLAAAARRIVAEEGGRTMDLERGPLARIALLRLTDERAALVITLHHIVTDGWAYPLLLSELWELYAAYRHGRALALPEPGLRYADYAVWQRGHLVGDTLERHVAYWRALLDDAPYTELPGDRPRPPVTSYRGAFHHFTVPPETENALRALCRREGATLNMVLSAAFAAVLARYCGSGDVVFGELFGNRNRPELERVVGCFVNSAALRVDLRDDPTFAEAVRRARRQVLDADAHQELPFELVVEHLRVERSPSRNPVFGAMYFHHTYIPAHSQAAGEAELDPRPVYGSDASLVDTGVAKLDLILATLEGGGKLTGSVEYSTDLYDASTIERFCRHLLTLAARAAAEPDLPLSRVDLLDDAERERLHAWSEGSGGFTPAAAQAPVHRRFEAVAAANPEADAVRYAGGAVSYAELDRRANAVAWRLRALGVGPETPVGVCMESGPALPAAVLGIWKAGGAYVPLDPANPAERLGWIVADAGLKVIVTAGGAADLLPPHHAAIVRADDPAAAADEGAPAVDVTADHLAYVIYTSGSTGRPKGVLVRHGSLAGLLDAARAEYGMGPGDVAPAIASFAFDIWLVEALLPLVSGAAVRMVERARVLDVPALLGELADVTHLHAVPALMREVARAEADAPRLRALRRAYVGGDSVPTTLLDEMRDAFASASVTVLYGPTEATILASAYTVPPGEVVGHPIGRPLRSRLYVCDEHGGLQPTGAPGELRIGGDGVARGYLGRAALTAEMFVPDPFGGVPGARLYRTGDRARWRADGVLDFLGRLDRQVKIRGFRIELGEVEVALSAVPGVRDAAVLVREDAPGARRLVAYASADPGVTGDELRDILRRRLPDYMVPSTVVVLDALPRTTTGKLDRRALPAPETSAGGAAYLAPRDEVEAALARAWAKVLGRDRVGVRDNFFELGGDSILAVRMITHAAEEGVRVLPWQLFRHQEIAALAEAVRADPDAGAADAADTAFSADGLDGLDGLDNDILGAVLGELGLE